MKTYYPVVQALRGLAAALVCVYHFVAYSDFRGALFDADAYLMHFAQACTGGVFIFFVVSSFVLPISLFQESKWIGFAPFILRRLIRIQLPYIVSIAMILAVGYGFSLQNHSNFNIEWARLFHHFTYSIPFTSFEWYNSIYWTLAIECQFYVLLGLFFVLRSRGYVGWAKSMVVMFVVSGCWVTDHRWIFHYALIFGLGIVYAAMQAHFFSTRKGLWILLLLVLAIVVKHGSPIAGYSAFTLVALHFGDRMWKYFHALGEMSYALYLTHGLTGGHVLYFLSRYTTTTSSKVALVALALLVSWACAYIFWKWVEQPTHRWARHWSSSRKEHEERIAISQSHLRSRFQTFNPGVTGKPVQPASNA